MVLAGHFERIVERTHIDVPGHLGVALADGRKQRHEIEDRVDMIPGHDGSHGRGIEGIQDLERSVFTQIPAFAHVGGDDVGAAVNPTQKNCQLGTNLTSGAYYQNTFHLFLL